MMRTTLIVAALISTAAVSDQSETAPSTCSFTPAITGDFPDPSLLIDPESGAAFAYATNIVTPSGVLINIPVSRAADARLTQWSPPEDAMPKLPSWAKKSYTWAPAIDHRRGEPYRLYFTARYGYSGRPCIGVATSGSPTGPFVPTSDRKPLICPLSEGGAIDPSVFREDDGVEYLLWKTDANCCEGAPTLYIQQLSADGLSLAAPDAGEGPWLLPNAVPLIRTDQAWEGRVIEAPTLRKHDGRYYLFYSGGDYATSSYSVGYASATSLLGPYQKAAAPILSSSTSSLDGPGGQDVFDGPNGDTLIGFHAWREGRPQRFRALYFGHVIWRPDGPGIMPDCARQLTGDH